ncbi:MAG: hypothetical protein JSS53_06240 [Proteobacteria bacterium]|nr:hypothetical protein [Pseudomonadota bacterium]
MKLSFTNKTLSFVVALFVTMSSIPSISHAKAFAAGGKNVSVTIIDQNNPLVGGSVTLPFIGKYSDIKSVTIPQGVANSKENISLYEAESKLKGAFWFNPRMHTCQKAAGLDAEAKTFVIRLIDEKTCELSNV